MDRRGFLTSLGFSSVAISTLFKSDDDNFNCQVSKIIQPPNQGAYITYIAVSGFDRRHTKRTLSQDEFTNIINEEAQKAKVRILERLAQ